MKRCPSQTLTAHGCRKLPQRNAAPLMPRKTAPCSIRIAARYRMQYPQTEFIRSALRPSPHNRKTARTRPQHKMTRWASQSLTAHGLPHRSFPRKTALRSIRIAARHRMQFPQTESIRSALRPLAARLKTARTLPQHKMTAMPIANDNGTGMPQAPAPERRPSHTPKNRPLQHSERSAASYAAPAD